MIFSRLCQKLVTTTNGPVSHTNFVQLCRNHLRLMIAATDRQKNPSSSFLTYQKQVCYIKISIYGLNHAYTIVHKLFFWSGDGGCKNMVYYGGPNRLVKEGVIISKISAPLPLARRHGE